MAQVLEVQLSAPATTQPELLVHHYTETGGQEQVVCDRWGWTRVAGRDMVGPRGVIRAERRGKSYVEGKKP